MTVPYKNSITKGIFAVSVVAVTAIVGSVGFAQADRDGGRGAGDGYGGTGALIRAAFATYEAAVSAAQTTFQTDVNACIAQSANPTPTISDGFNRRNSDAVSGLRSFAANPSRVNEDEGQLDRDFNGQEAHANAQISTSNAQLLDSLDQSRLTHNRNGLQQCLNTATNKFQHALQTAHQQLMKTLQDILHRRS